MFHETTYLDPEIHRNWRRVYHSSDTQSNFDDAVYDWLDAKLKPRGKWLDAGCGPGFHCVRIARSTGAEVLAVDISPTVLKLASETIHSNAFQNQIELGAYALEELPNSLDVEHVHSRGVLMHIPDWESALANLCRCIPSGGYLVLFENNSRSLETLIVKAVRRFRRNRSQIVDTDGGLEFWSDDNGKPFLVRVARVEALVAAMESHGVDFVLQRTASLIDLYRVPSLVRPIAIALNRIWFKLNLPFGSGVILVGKRS